MKIYTGFGDKGKTRLYGSEVVEKNHLRVECYGTMDELNSVLGIVLSHCKDKNISAPLQTVQNNLFRLSTELATPADQLDKIQTFILDQEDIQQIEHEIDIVQNQLVPLQNFILPGGGPLAAFLHLARTVCRRGERHIASLNQKENINPMILVYCNRLSDYLFVLARLTNKNAGISDVLWKTDK
ncbi:MAG: cob(I)yrinic acid a,c-diamide adenosyltransferase [Calditrichales bacterium]|nr:MAG: cob(I)yrinic acid a,c-diamide adenosyltransferase [Calditrichales bacterium]